MGAASRKKQVLKVAVGERWVPEASFEKKTATFSKIGAADIVSSII